MCYGTDFVSHQTSNGEFRSLRVSSNINLDKVMSNATVSIRTYFRHECANLTG